jgi:hypothetical protein
MRRARSARPEVGPRCGNCGSPDVELTRAGWAESLGAWLRFGGPWRPTRRVCRRCGQVDTAGSGAWLARPAGWWSLPVRLAGVVRRRRAMVPAPATYLMAVVAGAGLGVVAQLLAGWPWWLVTAGVVAAVWLLFLSSAFWGRAAARPLATEILLEVDPVRGLRRERQAMVELFRAAPFPLYGLPASWPGPRHLGGWGSRRTSGEPRVVTDLVLAHGDPAAARGPQLQVEVRVGPEHPEAGPELRHTLAQDLWWTAAASHAGGQAPPGLAGGPPDPARDPPWSPVTISVDGRPVGFDLLGEGRHWVAVGELKGQLLVLRARDLAAEEVELVRVTDVAPYVEGTRQFD